jgi:hypothetical protein
MKIFGRQDPANRKTGVDLHNGNPVFEFIEVEVPYTKHAVGYDWMRRQLPDDAMNKMLYFIDIGTGGKGTHEAAVLFGAVYDSYAYLFILQLDEA